MLPQKALCNPSPPNDLDTRSVTADTRPGVSRVEAPKFPVGALPRWNSLSAVVAGETTLPTTGPVLSGNKRRRPLQTSAGAYPKVRRHRPHCRSEISAGRALCRADGPGREEISRSPRAACGQGLHHSTQNLNPSPQPDTESSKQPKLTATRKTARPKKLETKSTAVAKPAAGKSKKKAAASVTSQLRNPQPPTWWSLPKVPHPQSRKFLISSITISSQHVWS